MSRHDEAGPAQDRPATSNLTQRQDSGRLVTGAAVLASASTLTVVVAVGDPGLAGVDLRQLAAFTSAARLQDRALSAVDAAARGTLLAVSVLGGDRVDAREALLSLFDLLTDALLDACDDELSGLLGDRL